MTANSLNKKITSASIITKLFAVFNLIAQAIIILLYCDGIVVFYGQKLTIISSVNFIISFTKLSKAGYSLAVHFRIWFGMALGILYIILLIYMIKQIISYILIFKSIISSKHVSADTLCDDTFEVGFYTGKIFFASTILIAICSLIKNFSFPASTYYIIIIGLLNYIATRIVISLIKIWLMKYQYNSLFKQIICLTVFCASVFILMYRSWEMPFIKNVFDIFPELLFAKEAKAIIAIIGNIILALAYAFLAIVGLVIIHTANEYEDFKTLSTHYASNVALCSALIIFVIRFLLTFSNGIEIHSTINLLKNWKDYVPLLCSAIAVCLSSSIHIAFNKNKTYEYEYKKTGEIDSNGVLRINTDTIKITSNIYQDCSNITKIMIPENVLEIERNAFYGCGGVTGIYCEAKSRPVGWDVDWCNGCYATIHWGATISNS